MGGSSAKLADPSNPALDNLKGLNTLRNSAPVQELLSKYAQGGMSLKEALAQASGLQGTTVDTNLAKRNDLTQQLNLAKQSKQPGVVTYGMGPTETKIQNLEKELSELSGPLSYNTNQLGGVARDALATDPITGSLVAADQVRSNPLTAGLFGAGGIQDQAQGRSGKLESNLDESRNALMGRDQSYGLTPEDLAAYGQASGNIARQFGQQGNNLAAMLSQQGLSSSANPSAAAFSGLLGNQNEQLAQSQLSIAQNRVNSAMQLAQARTSADLNRQAQNNQLMGNLGDLGQVALSNQFGRQLAGSENTYNQNAGTAGLTLNNRSLEQNINNSQWSQQQQSAFNPLSIIGGAISSGLGAFTGAAGKGLANNMVGGSDDFESDNFEF